MNEELTPEQKAQLSSWVSQRDLILVDIANKRVEQEKLTLTNKNLAASNTEIQDSINRSKGRLEELDKLEKEYEGITSNELASILAQKTQLETDVAGLKKEIGILITERDDLLAAIQKLVAIHKTLSESANVVEGQIGKVSEINTANRREVEMLIDKVKSEVQKVLDVTALNVDKTNAVINELPKMIFDLQREILERKHFSKIKHT